MNEATSEGDSIAARLASPSAALEPAEPDAARESNCKLLTFVLRSVSSSRSRASKSSLYNDSWS